MKSTGEGDSGRDGSSKSDQYSVWRLGGSSFAGPVDGAAVIVDRAGFCPQCCRQHGFIFPWALHPESVEKSHSRFGNNAGDLLPFSQNYRAGRSRLFWGHSGVVGRPVALQIGGWWRGSLDSFARIPVSAIGDGEDLHCPDDGDTVERRAASIALEACRVDFGMCGYPLPVDRCPARRRNGDDSGSNCDCNGLGCPDEQAQVVPVGLVYRSPRGRCLVLAAGQVVSQGEDSELRRV